MDIQKTFFIPYCLAYLQILYKSFPDGSGLGDLDFKNRKRSKTNHF